jgi:hypothetical protein
MKYKWCRKCNKDLPIEQFQRNRSKKDGYQDLCKPHKKEQQHDWYVAHAEEHKERVRTSNKQYRKTTIQLLVKYFEKHPCVDCGETDPVVLEFDHCRGKKTKEVSKLLYNHSWELVLKEIEKCDVRCANCHRRKTAKDFNWGKLASVA